MFFGSRTAVTVLAQLVIEALCSYGQEDWHRNLEMMLQFRVSLGNPWKTMALTGVDLCQQKLTMKLWRYLLHRTPLLLSKFSHPPPHPSAVLATELQSPKLAPRPLCWEYTWAGQIRHTHLALEMLTLRCLGTPPRCSWQSSIFFYPKPASARAFLSTTEQGTWLTSLELRHTIFIVQLCPLLQLIQLYGAKLALCSASMLLPPADVWKPIQHWVHGYRSHGYLVVHLHGVGTTSDTVLPCVLHSTQVIVLIEESPNTDQAYNIEVITATWPWL